MSLTEKNQVLYVFPKPTVDGQLYTELDPLTFLQHETIGCLVSLRLFHVPDLRLDERIER